ncbi:methyltransferase domain-containing protein [candidate division GN15 bacterium]|nr:methyltransferase domain-containing protein [candidate division GN15 bacterium]
MFDKLHQINSRPRPFEFYTAADLWTDDHTSAQMLQYHLNGDVDLSSRRTEFINQSVEWIIERFELSADKNVADFGCGPGLYTSRLARSGASITGIDFSTRSIDYARTEAARLSLAIDYIHADYLSFETDSRYDLIMMIFCDFCALSPTQRQTLLAKWHKLLTPTGSVLFDVSSLAAFNERKEAAGYELNQLNGFWSSEPYYGFFNTFKYDTEKVVLDKYTIVEQTRERVVYNWLQYFDVESLTAELERAGFAVDETIGDVCGTPFDPASDEFAVIARPQY